MKYEYDNSADNLSLMSQIKNQTFIYSTNYESCITNDFSEKDILFIIDNLKLPAKVIPKLSEIL
jgi:hypothetical protein